MRPVLFSSLGHRSHILLFFVLAYTSLSSRGQTSAFAGRMGPLPAAVIRISNHTYIPELLEYNFYASRIVKLSRDGRLMVEVTDSSALKLQA